MHLEEIRVHQARREHAAAIEHLELETLAVDPLRLAEAAFARKHEPVITLVALRRGRVAGYVTASAGWHGRSLNLWLLALAVDPAERRRGVGKSLLGALLEAGRGLGATRLRLSVRPENLPALALYRGFRFRVLARTPDALGPGVDVLRMARPISG